MEQIRKQHFSMISKPILSKLKGTDNMAKEFCTFAAGMLNYLASSSIKFLFNGTFQSKITIKYLSENPFALKILLGMSSVVVIMEKEFQYTCITNWGSIPKRSIFFLEYFPYFKAGGLFGAGAT